VSTPPHNAELLQAGGCVVQWSGPQGEPVVTVTLDRPDTRNSQDISTWQAFAHIGNVLPEATRIVVIRGQGSTFSSGLDKSAFSASGKGMSLSGLASLEAADLDAEIESFQRGFTWWRDNSKIISIAAVDGAAVGAGFQLALACDLRVATNRAKFSMREPALGLVPDLTGTHPLVRLVGYSRSLELCATTRWIEAQEAYAWGLVNAVDDDLDSCVATLVAHLLTIDEHALRETKALLQHAQTVSAPEQRANERAAQVRILKRRFDPSGNESGTDLT